MKNTALYTFAALSIAIATGGASNAADLRVKVTGVNNANGYVMIGLYNTEKTFKSSNLDWGAQIRAKPGDVVVTFANLPEGLYAVNAYHDADSSGEMEKNFLGIPSEGYGFANNARGLAGPPGFKASSISIGDKDLEIAFKLSY